MSQPRNDQVPRVINGRFSVFRTVGVGGFGQVLLAYDSEVGQLCAVKLLHEHLAGRPDIQKSFEREARAWLTLGQHPHIVSANAVDVFNGRLFISVEYVPPNQAGDNSLDKILRRQKIPVEQAIRWGLQLSEGMTYAQTKGLAAHRDLKPNNLMVDANDFIKVTDFGLSLFSISKHSAQESPAGTPLYMAPEAFEESAPINEKSDIYSAGLILYNLMSDGQMPFKIERVQDAASFKYFHRLHATYKPIKLECPIWPIIVRCLEKNPSKRHDSFQELHIDLAAAYSRLTGMSYRSIRPKEIEAYKHVNFSASFSLLNDPKHALSHIEEALRLKPQLMIAHNNKAAIYDSLGRNDEAEKIWRTVAEAAPELGRPLYNLGNQKMQKGDYSEAIELYKRALTREPSYYPALVNLGISYSKIGRATDALDCYSRASEICPNDSLILYNIGFQLYEMNRFDEAIEALWRTLGLNPNHTSALNYMGLCFAECGEETKALKYFDAAIAINPSYAYALSNKVKLRQGAWKKKRSLVARGLDALKNRPEVDPEKLFRDAVDAYERGDLAEAVKWLRKSADQGFAPAQGSLGVMYDEGRGVPQDYAAAANWYRKAGDQGVAPAQFNLGLMYDQGRGVPQDYAAAANWFRKAADQGNAKAQSNLGVMYAKGRGVPQNYAAAESWYRKAAAQGDSVAQSNLGSLYDQGRGVPQDYTAAANWYRKAADQGLAAALYNLGGLYESGRGVPQDFISAYMWFHLAAAQGQKEAVENRDAVAQSMTPAQIADAQRLAREWRPK